MLAAVSAFLLGGAAPLAARIVVVTDLPLAASMARSVGGEAIEARAMIDEPVSPHDFSLKPSEAGAISRADLVVVTSPHLSRWLVEAAESLAPSARVVLLEEGLEGLQMRQGHDEDDKHGHDDHEGQGHEEHRHEWHEHYGDIPEAELMHPWLDPAKMARWPEKLADAFGELAPGEADAFAQAAEGLADKIIRKDRETDAALAPYRAISPVISHDFLAPFVRHYRLVQPFPLSGADELPPSPRRIARARRLLASGEAACIMVTPWEQRALIERLAEETGRPLIVVDPAGLTLTDGDDLPLRLIEHVAGNWIACASEAVKAEEAEAAE